MEKWEDCIKCICLQCHEEFGVDPTKCKYSDCEWCEKEKGNYTERCNRYLDKGGTYGKWVGKMR